jgi:hypothetical protein
MDRASHQKRLRQENWEKCECSRFLLAFEDLAKERNEAIRKLGKSSDMIDQPCEALAAFSLILHGLEEMAPRFLDIANSDHLPEGLSFPDKTSLVGESPVWGELAARVFLKTASLTINEMKSTAADPWTFFCHGARLAEAWETWKNWVHRDAKGINYSDAAFKKLNEMAHPSNGGYQRAYNQRRENKHRDEDYKHRAANIEGNHSKSRKAELISDAMKREGLTPLSKDRIRRII